MKDEQESTMVYLNRIYTRSGDQGETSLGDGSRVPKTHLRIAAYGAVDEFNATLGMVSAWGQPDADLAEKIKAIQNDLFDVGADLCVPQVAGSESEGLRIIESQVTRLEKWIDEQTEQLQPLTSFILPGGSPLAALLHQARTICRRCEIQVLALAEKESVNPLVLGYVNRLSDLLFVWARRANRGGADDVLWTPGSGR